MYLLKVFSLALVLLLPQAVAAQVFTNKAQSVGDSKADLRFMRGNGVPVIAQETFFFRQDNWIIGRIRKGNTDFWSLTVPQSLENIAFLEPELATELTTISKQIGEGGAYRAQTEALLSDAGFKGSDVDAALSAGNAVWSTGMGWANVLQVGLGGTHVLYVAFYGEHNSPKVATNVPVDGALVALPGYVPPTPEPMFVYSPQALEFRASKEFARCGQQALLDAGYDPSGVDGAPGPGAQRALVAWAEANKITVPVFSRQTASQVCYLLTAPEPNLTNLPLGRMVAYPGAAWNGFTTKSGGLHEFSGIDVMVRFDNTRIRQVEALNFGPGITYRFERGDINQTLVPPWPITGTVFTHGTDAQRSQVLFELMKNDTVEAAQAVVDGQAGGYRGLMDDLLNRPNNIDARWSVIGSLDGADVVVLDALPTRADPAVGRVVIIFADDGNGGGKLLYAWHNRPIPGTLEIEPL